MGNAGTETNSFYWERMQGKHEADALQTTALLRDSSKRSFRYAYMPLSGGNKVFFEDETTEKLISLSEEQSDLEISLQLLDSIQRDTFAFEARLQNRGDSFFWGANANQRFCDYIGVSFFTSNETLSEHRIHLPFQVLVPGETAVVCAAFSYGDIDPRAPMDVKKDIFARIGCVRGGAKWYDCDAPIERTLNPLKGRFAATPLDVTTLSSMSEHISGNKSVALTFDGGSRDTHTKDLLRTLSELDVRCTFFLTGTFIRRFSDLVREAVDRGHEIANHTDSHMRLCYDLDLNPCEGVGFDVLQSELEKVDESLQKIVGSSCAPYWRAPFGGRNHRVLSWGRDLGYQHVGWNIDSEDWRIGQSAVQTSEEMGTRVKESVLSKSGGDIVLFHLSSANTTDPTFPALRKLIRELQDSGRSLVTIGSALHQGGLCADK